MKPKRIRLSRAKGWRKPEGAVVVARPTRWGNPFKVGGHAHWVLEGGPRTVEVRDAAGAVAMYRSWLNGAHFIAPAPPTDFSPLAGKDLACWCPLPAPGEPDICHAAVLLEIANQGEVR